MTQQEIIKEIISRGFYISNGVLYKKDGTIQYTYLSNGYPRLKIYINGYKMSVRVHRIVGYIKYGEAIFQKGLVIQHLDNDKLNYKIENLELCTHKQNMMNNPAELRKQIATIASNSDNFKKKCRSFTDNDIITIRRMYESKEMGVTKLAKLYKRHTSSISCIVNYKSYKDVK
jgi:hypothetical protein